MSFRPKGEIPLKQQLKSYGWTILFFTHKILDESNATGISPCFAGRNDTAGPFLKPVKAAGIVGPQLLLGGGG